MQQITLEDPMQNAIKYGKKVFTLSRLWNRITKIAKMVFCNENCSYCTVRKNWYSDQEKLLKFEAVGREFANFSRLLEQFTQTVKGQHNFGNRILF